ncbi:hypothetical protein, partial [Rhodopseudomonas sp. BAL398]|uniref:hypothetical protein n=1 Tax=Rhodopseudomonas sp. BAL398 TaxID=3034676 RepID=UPI0023E0BBFB
MRRSNPVCAWRPWIASRSGGGRGPAGGGGAARPPPPPTSVGGVCVVEERVCGVAHRQRPGG